MCSLTTGESTPDSQPLGGRYPSQPPSIASSPLFLGTTPSTTTSHSFLGTFAGTGIGASSLTARRQIPAVAQTTIAANFDQALDVELNLTPQITFDHETLANVIAQKVHLGIRQILDPSIGVHFGRRQDLMRPGEAYSIDICQTNFNPLVTR